MYGWEATRATQEHYFRTTPQAQNILSQEEPKGNKKIFYNILECVGNTPLVKLNVIPKEHQLECEFYAKCEYFNPAGSIKDRIAVAMMRDAETHGVVNKDTVFVEPTSGNTGIAVGYAASLSGKSSIIITSLKNSDEKVNTMRLLGSEVIQIKTTDSEIGLARRIKDQDPKRVVMLDQFDNDVNPHTHYDTTAVEILDALDNINMVVMGAGTGGTMGGVGHRFKEKKHDCLVIAAEPDGSTMINKQGKRHPFLVEGIGGSMLPIVLDTTIIDGFEVVTDEDAFKMARELNKKEGLLCGGSSGVAMHAAIQAAKKYKLGAGQRVVVILPDGIRNYMSKFVSDQWMEAYRFKDPPNHTMSWWETPASKLTTNYFLTIDTTYTCDKALYKMYKSDLIAIVEDENKHYVGVVSKDAFRNYATNPTKLPWDKSEEFNWNSLVTDYLVKHVYTLALNPKNKTEPTIGLVSRILDITDFVVLGEEIDDGAHFKVRNVVTSADVLQHIYDHSSH